MKDKAIQHESGLYIVEDIYSKNDRTYFWLQMYYPKAKKPFCNILSKTEDLREEYKEKQIKAYYELQTLKARRKEARKATPEKLSTVPIGSIFNWSWGYKQTNQNYYQLIELKGQLGTFRELAQERHETDFLQGDCKPIKDNFIGEPFKKKIQFQNNEAYIKMESFGWCNLWDGRTDYYTAYH